MCETSMGQEARDDMLVESAGLVESEWMTADGQHIKYEDLTDLHLENILRYLSRQQGIWSESKIEDLEMERDRRKSWATLTPSTS